MVKNTTTTANGQNTIEVITAVTVPPSRTNVASRPRLPMPGDVGCRQFP
jgi:hypothetical protein